MVAQPQTRRRTDSRYCQLYFYFPAEGGGCTFQQVLNTHNSQLVELTDHITEHIGNDWRNLCVGRTRDVSQWTGLTQCLREEGLLTVDEMAPWTTG